MLPLMKKVLLMEKERVKAELRDGRMASDQRGGGEAGAAGR